MAEKPHPVALEQLHFVRSVVIAVPEHTPEKGIILPGPENNLSVVKDETIPGLFHGSMRSQMNTAMDKAYPYCIDMECICDLTVDASLSEEEAVRGAMITANSVLFGAIREAVGWITGRQPYGPVMLGLSVLGAGSPKTAL